MRDQEEGREVLVEDVYEIFASVVYGQIALMRWVVSQGGCCVLYLVYRTFAATTS